MKKYILGIAITLMGAVSNAQIMNPNNTEARLRNAERQIFDLQQKNMQLDSRVRQIEDYLYNTPPLPPDTDGLQVCVVQNTAYNNAHVGKSVSRIEAEAIAKNTCANGGYSSNCQKAQCDVEDYREHTCKMTNTAYNKDTLGRAKSVLEAKAMARNACVALGYSSNCSEASVVCD